jgi:light-regulated signal transduction histidine kinase (bacteriophytochrome)
VSETDTLEQPEEGRARALEARNRRLEEALQAANIEIDSLTYSIAHDLRTPLMHIEGFAQLLQSSTGAVLDAESRDHLERIIGAARTMGELIGSLVEYARVNSAPLASAQVELEGLLDEVLQEIRPWTDGRSIQWQRSRLPCVQGDAGLLRQVLLNLLSNAVKFTRQRELAVIEIGARESGSGFIVFVRDNGVGFDLKYAKRLFGPFQRMHPADAFRGIGMGLAKVRRIVSRHGGRVWADAQTGHGATFYFSLPADPAA